jgi:very-short-patch-repair endonuclease
MSQLDFARHLRQNPTDAERALWCHLRMRQLSGHKFRRQYAIQNFIIDFVCIERRLAIELDGSQHFSQSDYDAARTGILEAQGYRVLRFWNNELFENMEGVLEVILAALEENKDNPHPSLPP